MNSSIEKLIKIKTHDEKTFFFILTIFKKFIKYIKELIFLFSRKK